MGVTWLLGRGAFEISAGEVAGKDARPVHAAASRAVARARRGEGPAFLLCQTYRFLGHHVGDISRAYYRTKDEELRYKAERDPLRILTRWLVAERMAAPEEFARAEQQVRAEVAAGLQFALAAPYPDPGEVDRDVYA